MRGLHSVLASPICEPPSEATQRTSICASRVPRSSTRMGKGWPFHSRMPAVAALRSA